MGGELPRLSHEIVGKIVVWRGLWLAAFFTCQQHLGFTSDCNKEFVLDFCVFCYVSDNKRGEHSCVRTLTASPSRHEEAPRPYCTVRVESNHVELVLCSGKAEDRRLVCSITCCLIQSGSQGCWGLYQQAPGQRQESGTPVHHRTRTSSSRNTPADLHLR